MDSKFSRVGTYDEEKPPLRSRDTSTSWSCDKSKRYISTFTRPTASKTWQGADSGWGAQSKKSRNTLILYPRDNSKSSHYFKPMTPKFSKMGSLDWRIVTCKPNSTSVSSSRYKDVISSLARGLWPMAFAKDERTSPKNLKLSQHFHHLTNWKRYTWFFWQKINLKWRFTLLICISAVLKPRRL